MQTNEVQNIIIHYSRSANGTLTEVERIPTSGAGSGLFKPISGQKSAPNAFLLVGTTFDLPFALSGTYPDGSPILWIKGARRQMEGDRFQCAGSRRPRRIPRAR